MNVENDITATDDGYVCTECGGEIPIGSDAITAMHSTIDTIESTGDPQNITFQYAGIYHPECFRGGGGGDGPRSHLRERMGTIEEAE